MAFQIRWREFGAPGRPESLEHVHFARCSRGREGVSLGLEVKLGAGDADAAPTKILDNFLNAIRYNVLSNRQTLNFVCDMFEFLLLLRTCST